MLLLQVNTALQFAGGTGAAEASVGSSAVSANSDSLQDPQHPSGAPENAVQPGPPVNRLDIRTQNQAQVSGEEAEAEEEAAEAGETQFEGAQRTNEEGEPVNQEGLTEAEQREVESLKAREREVRAHERAHATAGGGIAGQPQFTFQVGPDGKQYAVGGEVSIDTSSVSGNPEATIRKMEQVKRAALAPSNPSGQDRRVAAEAEGTIQAARQEIQAEKREEQAERAEKRSEGQEGASVSVGQSEPVFNPEARFQRPVGGIGSPLGTGLAGSGELNMDTGTLQAGELFNLVA